MTTNVAFRMLRMSQMTTSVVVYHGTNVAKDYKGDQTGVLLPPAGLDQLEILLPMLCHDMPQDAMPRHVMLSTPCCAMMCDANDQDAGGDNDADDDTSPNNALQSRVLTCRVKNAVHQR